MSTNYSELLNKAISIAKLAHKGQLDKGNKPYIEHPKYIASKMVLDEEKIVAFLHDVVEDTNVTLKDLSSEGFDELIIEALTLLTHQKEVLYFEYINHIKKNELARKVKIEDLKHNLDISRINNPTKKDIERIEKYKKALNILTLQ